MGPMSRVRLKPDPARVVIRPFTPAENSSSSLNGPLRAARILDRVLSLDIRDVDKDVDSIISSLQSRHIDVRRILMHRYHDIVEPHVCGRTLSDRQKLLAGAYFVEEYSFEAAALFNPSVVLHPDQRGTAQGSIRLILSLRAVGEGHVSSVTFRTATLGPDARLEVNSPSSQTISPQIDRIPGGAPDDPGLRLFFGDLKDLSQVVIFPVTYQQRMGIEDMRLTRFVEDDGHVTFFGTYTAFSGERIRQEMLRTTDFATMELNALDGALSATKGMALFPKRIGGRYAMLGRHDHENIWFLQSNDLYRWEQGKVILAPRWPWEFVQIGVCSPPIETEAGWLVIIHGVGAVRNYCLGCCLLDKEDPSKVIARSTKPLMQPGAEARNGYVPNVTYTCGALVHEGTLILPYGVADSFTTFARFPLSAILASMS